MSEYSFTRSGLVVRKGHDPGDPYYKVVSLNDFSYGYFISRRLEAGAVFSWGNGLSNLFKNIGGGRYGAFISVYFPGSDKDRLVPYIGITGSGKFVHSDLYSEPNVEIYAGLKRFVSSGDGAVSLRAFISEDWYGWVDDSFRQYGFSIGISAFRKPVK